MPRVEAVGVDAQGSISTMQMPSSTCRQHLVNFTLARFDRGAPTPFTFAARVFRALSTNAALRRSVDDEMTHKVEAVLTLYNDGGDDDEPMRVTVPLQ